MSDMNYDLSFNVEGQRELARALESLGSLRHKLNNVRQSFKTVVDEAGEARKQLVSRMNLKGLTGDEFDRVRLTSGVVPANLTDKDVNYVETHRSTAAARRRDQIAEAARELKEQQSAYKNQLSSLRNKNKQALSLITDTHKLIDKARKQDATREKATADAKTNDFRKSVSIKEGLAKQQILNDEKFAAKKFEILNKIGAAEQSSTAKSKSRQQEIKGKLDEVRRKLEQTETSYRQYHSAIQNGDKTQAAVHAWAANRFINQTNAMANATEKFAAKQERGLKKTKNNYESLLKSVNKTSYQMHSLNRLAHLTGLVGGFYLAERAARGYFNAVKESVKYNDELKQAEVVFTSLATTDIGKSVAAIERDAIPAELKKLEQAKIVAKQLTDDMRATAAYTGQNLGEVMSTLKVTLPDIMNKYALNNKNKNMFLDDTENVRKFSTQLVELASVMKMVDPQGRKLSWHAVAIGEAFSGTMDGSKSFKANFMSLLRRENVKLAEEVQKDVTAKISKGDYSGAMRAFMEGLKRSGLYRGKLEDLMVSTIGSNWGAVKAHLAAMFGAFNRPLAVFIAEWLRKLNVYLHTMSQKKEVKKFLHELGVEQAAFVKRIVESITRFAQFLIETKKGQQMLKDWKALFAGILEVGISIGKVIFAFASGLFGANEEVEKSKDATDHWTKGLKTLAGNIGNLQGPAKTFGGHIKTIADNLGKVIAKFAEIESKYGFILKFFENTGNIIGHGAASHEEAMNNRHTQKFQQKIKKLQAELDQVRAQKEKQEQIGKEIVGNKALADRKLEDARTGKNSGNTTINFNNAVIQTPDAKQFVKDLQGNAQGRGSMHLPVSPIAGY